MRLCNQTTAPRTFARARTRLESPVPYLTSLPDPCPHRRAVSLVHVQQAQHPHRDEPRSDDVRHRAGTLTLPSHRSVACPSPIPALPLTRVPCAPCARLSFRFAEGAARCAPWPLKPCTPLRGPCTLSDALAPLPVPGFDKAVEAHHVATRTMTIATHTHTHTLVLALTTPCLPLAGVQVP